MKKKLTTMSFIMQDAEDSGLGEAVFLYNLRFWIEINFKKEEMHKDGLVWMYHTLDQFCDQFPFWTRDQVRHIIKKLRSSGRILVGDYSKNRSVRPLWYTMPEYELQPCGKFPTSENHVVDVPPVEVVDVPPVEVVDVPLQGGGRCPTSSTKDNKEKIIHKDNKQEVADASDVVENKFLSKIPKKYHEDIIQVLEFWSNTMSITFRAQMNTVINQKRGKAVHQKLSEGYTPDDCLKAVEGCLRSPFHMGKNDRNTKYNQIDNIFNDKNFEKFMSFEQTSSDYSVPSMDEWDEINKKMGFGEYADDNCIDVTPEHRLSN